jgi:hypothetical protein
LIPIFLVRPATLTCPYCQALLKRGKPRFGPDAIKCGNCAREIKTGLSPWLKFSPRDRFFLGLGELFAPSRWGTVLTALLLELVICPATVIVFACPGLFIHAIASAIFSDMAATIIVSIIFSILPLGLLALSFSRLTRMIKESNEYSQTGLPPSWRAGAL